VNRSSRPPIASAAPRPAALAACAALLVLPLVPAVAPSAQAQEAGAEEAVRRVADGLHAALASGDSARVLGLLADGVRVYESGHAETREEYRAGHLGIDIEFAGGTEREVLSERVRLSGDVALYLAEYRTTGTFRGEEIDGRGTETLVMERRPEGWGGRPRASARPPGGASGTSAPLCDHGRTTKADSPSFRCSSSHSRIFSVGTSNRGHMSPVHSSPWARHTTPTSSCGEGRTSSGMSSL